MTAKRRPGAAGCRLLRDRSGATALVTGLAMTMLIGFAGLAIDVASWQVTKRNMQGAADQAAFSAVVANGAGGGASPTTQADGITASFGFVNGSKGTTVTVNNPPATGNYTSDSNAFEVIIQQPQTRWFANLFLSSPPTVSARSVATFTTTGACIISLQPTGPNGVNISGGSDVTGTHCVVYVNSSDPQALQISGGATLDVADAYVVGNYSNGGNLDVSGTLKTGSSAIADPYASRTAPTIGACTSSAGGYSGTISPGVYCNGIKATGPLTLNPGVYILSGGGFNVSGGSSSDPYLSGGVCTSPTGKSYVNATGGVTIYLGPSTNNNPIQVSSCLSITAPTTGNTAGMAFWVDKNAPSNGKDQFNGGTAMLITGAVYTPDQEVDYTGSSVVTSPCTQIVANNINFTGSTTDNFETNCTGTGVWEPAGTGSGVPVVVE